MSDELILAVAGGGKTQWIIDSCKALPSCQGVLALTYTKTGQWELSSRLRSAYYPSSGPEVVGWYQFILRNFVRPYLPCFFSGERLFGFNFDGAPSLYARGRSRYLDGRGHAYRRTVAKLAFEVNEAAKGKPVDRLERWYTDIFIDEVQDLVGWDLEILATLLKSRLRIHMVGDLRQSLLETNPRDRKNKQYRGLDMMTWFRSQECRGLRVKHRTRTYRSNQAIADFADSIFSHCPNFPPTESQQNQITGHDGIFSVSERAAPAYIEEFQPQCLRHSRAVGKKLDWEFRNFGEVKGLTFPRVLIYPTKPIKKWLTDRKGLADKTACGLYVAVTRARHSVAFVLEPGEAEKANIRSWP